MTDRALKASLLVLALAVGCQERPGRARKQAVQVLPEASPHDVGRPADPQREAQAATDPTDTAPPQALLLAGASEVVPPARKEQLNAVSGEEKRSPQSGASTEVKSVPHDHDAEKTAPKTVDEAVDRLLATIPDDDKLRCKRTGMMQFIAMHHHTNGRWIRNNFLSGNRELREACEKRAGRRFRGYWPDEASSVILQAVWEKCQTLPLEDEENASRLWRMAENYLLNGAREAAIAKLREILVKYPVTGHAGVARKKLEELER